MKTIGLLGGMSWESTVSYYQIINRAVGERLGGLHSAKILLHSVDFAEIERLQHADRWAEAGSLLAEAAMALEGAGADFLVICTNTMHRVAPEIEARVHVPLLHIADPTAEAVKAAGKTGTGEMGLEEDFHSWFVAFAPYEAEDPDDQVVVVVMVEAGTEGYEWWSPKAGNAILQGIFADQDYDAAVDTLGIWYLQENEAPW